MTKFFAVAYSFSFPFQPHLFGHAKKPNNNNQKKPNQKPKDTQINTITLIFKKIH